VIPPVNLAIIFPLNISGLSSLLKLKEKGKLDANLKKKQQTNKKTKTGISENHGKSWVVGDL